MVELLLALIFLTQIVLIGMVWVGTNIQDRLWQLPVVGSLLYRRAACGHHGCLNRAEGCWMEVGTG